MVDVRGDFLRSPHGTTPVAVKSNKNEKWDPLRAMKTFIRKKVGHTTQFRPKKGLISDPVITRQRKPEETYWKFAIFK